MKKLFLTLSLLSGSYAAQYEENTRLCDEGNMVGCYNMGIMYMKGIRGASKNEDQAFAYFKKACQGGDIDGCLNAGKYFEDGIGVKQAYTKAAVFYTIACNGGEAYACMMLGNIYRDGKGTIEHDSQKAAGYFKQVCDFGYSVGCEQYEKIKKQ